MASFWRPIPNVRPINEAKIGAEVFIESLLSNEDSNSSVCTIRTDD